MYLSVSDAVKSAKVKMFLMQMPHVLVVLIAFNFGTELSGPLFSSSLFNCRGMFTGCTYLQHTEPSLILQPAYPRRVELANQCMNA